MKSSNVWVVTLCEDGKRGFVLGVFSTADAAAAYVESSHASFVFGEYRRNLAHGLQVTSARRANERRDWINICAHRVQ